MATEEIKDEAMEAPQTEPTEEQKAIEAFATDLEALQKKHNLRVVPVARLEVQYIEKPKPVLDLL